MSITTFANIIKTPNVIAGMTIMLIAMTRKVL